MCIRSSLLAKQLKPTEHLYFYNAYISLDVVGLTIATDVLVEATKTTIDKLQRVLNAAARFVSGTLKFNRGLTYLHSDLTSDSESSTNSDEVNFN